MIWGSIAFSIKAFWSSLIAAALVWSGVALTDAPPGARDILSETPWLDDSQGSDSGSGPAGSPASSRRASRQSVDSPLFFDAGAGYRVLTGYGRPTEVLLSDYLATGVPNVAFSLLACDEFRADYYRSVVVENGKLKLESNVLGHVHGPRTQSETVCTVTATGVGGSQDREFSLYTVSDRTPPPLPPGSLSVVEARSEELDLRVALPGGSAGYLRIGWRASGGAPRFAVASGVGSDTVLTVSGLQTGTTYEIRAYLMTAQAFDLYRESNTGPDGTLIAEGNPASKWISNLAGAGLGKSLSLSQATLPSTPPEPDPLPPQPPDTVMPPNPRPTPDEDDEDDDGDSQTLTPTDNDGIDTPTPATVTPLTPTPATITPTTPTPVTALRRPLPPRP